MKFPYDQLYAWIDQEVSLYVGDNVMPGILRGICVQDNLIQLEQDGVQFVINMRAIDMYGPGQKRKEDNNDDSHND